MQQYQGYSTSVQQRGRLESTNSNRQQYEYSPSQPGERTESTRQLSSVIVGSEYLGPLPKQDQVTYVEVPCIEEVVTHVPKIQMVEVERRVPVIQYEYVDRIVEVPQINYVDRHVDVTQVQEVVRHVPKIEHVDRNVDVVRHVPRVEVKHVEKIVDVPGELIEVPKPYTVENRVPVARFVDKEMPVVVSQLINPYLSESNKVKDVPCLQYEPQVVAVDIHVAKPVQSHLELIKTSSEHHLVSVPAAQYNSILKALNGHLDQSQMSHLPFATDGRGHTPFLAENMPLGCQTAETDIQGYNRHTQHHAQMDYERHNQNQSARQSTVVDSTYYNQRESQMSPGGGYEYSNSRRAPAKAQPRQRSRMCC